MRHEVLSHIVFNLMHVQAVVESIIHILLFFHDADPVTMELSFPLTSSHFFSLPKTAH